ncbi:hypothetical protein KUV44_12520 [Marinobacter daepoensis]|uniref:Uncharacterized protein n=1 Tax=Marinobacter daepoensis TaxID=262077 RepID=A0ABS3BKI2_9GAMM|nr:hypothetical protein [Marinobacter daepoensis]MBN7771366.1 hypothetical protein [Marinobacter daepoensis]MBY6079967.1 hypothetical protein [Marinobacter daepoensis]
MQESELHTLLTYQRTYFEILEEFFIGATGCSFDKFCSPSEFSEAIRKLGESMRNDSKRSSVSMASFESLAKKLGELYSQESMECFRSAKNIKCCKINLGGSSRFLETQLNSVKKTILVSDIVLIPDPLMPWLEAKREHEKFRFVNIIQAAYFILHLKNLLSQDFEIPPFFVFPSWEKSLEEKDQQTRDETNQLIADFFSFYVNREIISIDDVFDYVDSDEKNFLAGVEEKGLFISPGGEIGESLRDALKNYREEAEQWRTPEFNEMLAQAPEGRIVLNGIMERVQPQFHLFENSNELNSNPLLCIPAQAHYFSLLSRMDNSRVSEFAGSDKSLSTAISALTNSRLDYLANIADEQIIELRKTDENIRFRNELRGVVASLPTIKVDDLDDAAAEVCSHVESLISAHQKEVEILNGKYQAKHMKSALIAGGGLAVTMVPALAPFLGAALPLALAAGGKYTADKFEESHERKVLSSSMLGIFALAKDASKNR